MQKFDVDHAQCLNRYFQSGRKECLVISAKDGALGGFDPYQYGQKWKRAFAKCFESVEAGNFVVKDEAKWEDEFCEYLAAKNKPDNPMRTLGKNRSFLRGSLSPPYDAEADTHPLCDEDDHEVYDPNEFQECDTVVPQDATVKHSSPKPTETEQEAEGRQKPPKPKFNRLPSSVAPQEDGAQGGQEHVLPDIHEKVMEMKREEMRNEVSRIEEVKRKTLEATELGPLQRNSQMVRDMRLLEVAMIEQAKDRALENVRVKFESFCEQSGEAGTAAETFRKAARAAVSDKSVKGLLEADVAVEKPEANEKSASVDNTTNSTQHSSKIHKVVPTEQKAVKESMRAAIQDLNEAEAREKTQKDQAGLKRTTRLTRTEVMEPFPRGGGASSSKTAEASYDYSRPGRMAGKAREEENPPWRFAASTDKPAASTEKAKAPDDTKILLASLIERLDRLESGKSVTSEGPKKTTRSQKSVARDVYYRVDSSTNELTNEVIE